MRRLHMVLLAVIIAALVLAGLPIAPAAVPPVHAQDGEPAFEPTACSFSTDDYTIECGFLTVPENRTTADSRTIRVAVAIVRSVAANPAPDPLLILEGGPGLPLVAATPYVAELFAPVLRDRDLILVDQRGAGLSEPSLACPEYSEQILADLASGQQLSKALNGNLEGMLRCQERLQAEGIDLSGYNTREITQDIVALRRALGYAVWNIYGVSYGSRLTLEVMAADPDGTRSAILDSTYPPTADIYLERAANVDRALRVVFDACDRSAPCDASFPDLETVFADVVTTLNREPVLIEARDFLRGERYAVVLSGDLFSWLINGLLRSPSGIQNIPRLIYAAFQQDYAELSLVVGGALQSPNLVSYGMYYSVMCSEAVPFSAYEPDNAPISPLSSGQLEGENRFAFALCEHWAAGRVDPAASSALESAVPTLVFGGTFDPTTPPAWGAQTAARLPNSHYLEFAAASHTVIAIDNACPTRITASFLDDPYSRPNVACQAYIPPLEFTIGGR